jgi:hypothetical protein
MTPDHLVLLLPGFFGFTRISGFYYFAERVAAAIRGGLDMYTRRSIPVVPLSTPPAGSLCDRQDALLAQIHALTTRIGGAPRLHLLGHSAGGIDAYLLTCERRASDAPWTDVHDQVRRRIASVTTVASPFRGTSLSATAAARFALDPRHNSRGVVVAWKVLREVVPRHAEQALFGVVLGNALTALPDAAKFCWQLLHNRQLISDLAPDRMEQLLSDNPRAIDVPITNFVTVVPDEALQHASPFFADLYALTSGDGQACPVAAAVNLAAELLNARASEAIRPVGCAPPVFTPRNNDGVVNSARQLLDPGDRSMLGGVFVADHADVLGYYDHVDTLVTGRPLNQSVFRSGAGFCDDEFFELYRRVTCRITEAMRAHRSSPPAAH